MHSRPFSLTETGFENGFGFGFGFQPARAKTGSENRFGTGLNRFGTFLNKHKHKPVEKIMPRTSLGTIRSKNSCQGRVWAHSCRKNHAEDEFGHIPVEKVMTRTISGTFLSKNSCQGRVWAHSCRKIHADWQAGRFQSGLKTVFWRKRFSQSGFGFVFYTLPVAYGVRPCLLAKFKRP